MGGGHPNSVGRPGADAAQAELLDIYVGSGFQVVEGSTQVLGPFERPLSLLVEWQEEGRGPSLQGATEKRNENRAPSPKGKLVGPAEILNPPLFVDVGATDQDDDLIGRRRTLRQKQMRNDTL